MNSLGAGPLMTASRNSVRIRLLVSLSSLLSILLLVGSISDYRSSLRPVLEAYDQALVETAIGLAAYLNTNGPHVRFDLPARARALLQTDPRDTVTFRVLGPDDATIGGDERIPSVRDRSLRGFHDTELDGGTLRLFSLPIHTADGWCAIIVAETVVKRDAARRQILISRVVTDSLVLLLTLAVVWFTVGAALRPLERLARQVQSRGGDDLRPLPDDDVPGEARPLVRALNRLFTLIGETQEAQRRFIENAAHQLRTPLAGLKGQLDLVADEVRSQQQLPAALRERVDRVQQATNRLTHLANQMLTLARSDRPTHDSASRQSLSLPALVDEVVSAQLDAALLRRQDLGAETRPAMLNAVAWELRELLGNLIDNAIRYTPMGGRITVRCGVEDGRPFVEVEDDGIGIPAPERQRVFERFYRVAGSPAGGSGLGLAIVREIATLYGGRVQLKVGEAGTGVRVRVDFAPG